MDNYEFELYRDRMLLNIREANIPPKFNYDDKLTPAEIDLEAFERLDKVRNGAYKFTKEGYNLLICSNNTGNGKTSWALKILYNYLIICSKRGEFKWKSPNAYFFNVPLYFLNRRRAINNEDYQRIVDETDYNVSHAGLVVFDDISSKALRDFDKDAFHAMVEERQLDNKASIYTTNSEPSNLINILDEKTYDRIVNNSKVITLKGASNRKCNWEL